jgi:autotransporter-associated beta strand protein
VAPFPHVTITGVSTYTGPTDIQTGTLAIGFVGSIASSSEIKLSNFDSKLDVLSIFGGYTIPQTQKLSGIGDWDGRILLDGVLAPEPGIATMTGDDLTFDGTGKFQFNLSLVDNSSDRISLLGAFDKGTAGNYVFDFQGTGAINQTYTLATFASTTFTATDFSYTALAPGLSGTFVLNANDLMFVTIPEPSTALLCAAAGAVAALRRRRAR